MRKLVLIPIACSLWIVSSDVSHTLDDEASHQMQEFGSFDFFPDIFPTWREWPELRVYHNTNPEPLGCGMVFCNAAIEYRLAGVELPSPQPLFTVPSREEVKEMIYEERTFALEEIDNLTQMIRILSDENDQLKRRVSMLEDQN